MLVLLLKSSTFCLIGLICAFAALGNGNNRGTAGLLWLLGGGFFGYGIYRTWVDLSQWEANEQQLAGGYSIAAGDNYGNYAEEDYPYAPPPAPRTPQPPTSPNQHPRREATQPTMDNPTITVPSATKNAPRNEQPAPSNPQVANAPARLSNNNPAILFYQIKIWIIGLQQGSGKTSVLDRLIAEHLKLGHITEFVNPFAPKAEYKGLTVWGRGDDYNNAAKGIAKFTLEMNRRIRLRGRVEGYEPLRDEPKYFLAVDELTEYARQMPATIYLEQTFDSLELAHLLEGMTSQERYDILSKPYEPLVEFFAIILNRIRQANGAIAYASHGKTQALSGGSAALAGHSEVALKSCFRVHRYAKVDPDNPSGFSPQEWAEFYPPHTDTPIRVYLDSHWQAPNPQKDFSGLGSGQWAVGSRENSSPPAHLPTSPPAQSDDESEPESQETREPDDENAEELEGSRQTLPELDNLHNVIPFPLGNPPPPDPDTEELA